MPPPAPAEDITITIDSSGHTVVTGGSSEESFAADEEPPGALDALFGCFQLIGLTIKIVFLLGLLVMILWFVWAIITM